MFPAQPNRSLADGLTVLQAVSAAARPVGSRDLARQLGMEHTRVNRLLGTLGAVGICEQTADRKYRPGPGLHVIAATALFGSQILGRSAGPIATLREAAPNLTVAIGVRWRTQVAYLLHLSPGQPVAEGIGRTALYPAERSSIGIVLLAKHSVPELTELFGNQTARVRALVEGCRRDGFALAQDAIDPTLAVPLGKLETAHVALAVAGAIRADEVPGLVVRLRRTAGEIQDKEKIL